MDSRRGRATGSTGDVTKAAEEGALIEHHTEVAIGKFVVSRTRASWGLTYTVSEPTVFSIRGPLVWDYVAPRHSSMATRGGDKMMGQLGTRLLTAELEALPGWEPGVPGSGRERQELVGAYHEAQYQLAYHLIGVAFPEAKDGSRSMGRVDVYARTESKCGGAK